MANESDRLARQARHAGQALPHLADKHRQFNTANDLNHALGELRAGGVISHEVRVIIEKAWINAKRKQQGVDNDAPSSIQTPRSPREGQKRDRKNHGGNEKRGNPPQNSQKRIIYDGVDIITEEVGDTWEL